MLGWFLLKSFPTLQGQACTTEVLRRQHAGKCRRSTRHMKLTTAAVPTCTERPSADAAPPEHSCSLQSPAAARPLCSTHCWVTAHQERRGQGMTCHPGFAVQLFTVPSALGQAGLLVTDISQSCLLGGQACCSPPCGSQSLRLSLAVLCSALGALGHPQCLLQVDFVLQRGTAACCTSSLQVRESPAEEKDDIVPRQPIPGAFMHAGLGHDFSPGLHLLR